MTVTFHKTIGQICTHFLSVFLISYGLHIPTITVDRKRQCVRDDGRVGALGRLQIHATKTFVEELVAILKEPGRF